MLYIAKTACIYSQKLYITKKRRRKKHARLCSCFKTYGITLCIINFSLVWFGLFQHGKELQLHYYRRAETHVLVYWGRVYFLLASAVTMFLWLCLTRSRCFLDDKNKNKKTRFISISFFISLFCKMLQKWIYLDYSRIYLNKSTVWYIYYDYSNCPVLLQDKSKNV